MFESMAKMGLKKIIRDKMTNKKLVMNINELLELIENFTDNEINIYLNSNESITFEDLNEK